QQVIKRNVLSSEKTLNRKIREAWLAIELEREYSKEEILEIYINNVYLGNGSYGFKTASKSYFSEDLEDINLSQIALLAGLPNSPSSDNPVEHPDKAEKRRNQVLQSMVNNEIISQEEAEEAKEEQTNKKESDSAIIDTAYEQLIEQEEIISEDEFYQGGLKIYTTVEPDLQKSVNEILSSDDIAYPDDNFEVGIALIDTTTGAI